MSYLTNVFHEAFVLIIIFLRHICSLSASAGENSKTTFVCQLPMVPLNCKVIQRIRALGDYLPPWWYNRHLFALIPFSNSVTVGFKRETHYHSDGSSFVSDTYPNIPSDKSHSRIVVLVPGLASTSLDSYVMNFAHTLEKNGYYTVVLGTRGFEYTGNKEREERSAGCNNKMWHPGFHSDGLLLLDVLRENHPHSSLFLAGFSAGSNIVQNILIHNNNRPHNRVPIKGVFCCCINYCYLSTMLRLEQHSGWTGKWYSWMLALQTKIILKKNLALCRPAEEVDNSAISSHVEECTLMSDFDGKVRSELYKFSSKEQQYECFSGMKAFTHMHAGGGGRDELLSPPLLLLQPHDDPLHQGSVHLNIPVSEIVHSNPNAIYMETPHGNHFGFVEGSVCDHIFSRAHSSYTFPARVCSEFFSCVYVSSQST